MNDVTPPDQIAFIDLARQQQALRGKIDAAVARVLDHGQYVMGPEVGALEQALAGFCGARHAITCASGTDALLLALMAEGLRPGDAVVVPSFTFCATAEMVCLLGGVPVFADVREDSFNLDPESLKAAVATAATLGLRLRGVISVDLFGQPCQYAAIEQVAHGNGLWLISDAAQSFGGSYGGRRVGRIGDITTTSFFPSKPLGCYGDGGAVFTDDDALAETIRSLRVHGQGRDKYDNVRVGINGRLDTIQAAILLEKLAIFPDELAAREAVAARYAAILPPEAVPPAVMDGTRSAWALYTIRTAPRDAAQQRLQRHGIPSMVYYRCPLHRQTAYRGFPVAGNGLPVSERLAETVLSLPMHPYLGPEDQARVAAALAVAD